MKVHPLMVTSIALPESNRSSTCTDTCVGDTVDHQSVHIRLRDQLSASAIMWSVVEETRMIASIKQDTLAEATFKDIDIREYCCQRSRWMVSQRITSNPTMYEMLWAHETYHVTSS